jgi:hypothetical protein
MAVALKLSMLAARLEQARKTPSQLPVAVQHLFAYNSKDLEGLLGPIKEGRLFQPGDIAQHEANMSGLQPCWEELDEYQFWVRQQVQLAQQMQQAADAEAPAPVAPKQKQQQQQDTIVLRAAADAIKKGSSSVLAAAGKLVQHWAPRYWF